MARKSTRRTFLGTMGVGVLAAAMGRARAAERPPNFVVIFADDLGYGDLGCFGCEHHRTPHIDKMAAEGMRLTSFYVTSGVCTPSRSSLMTGCYPRRVGMDTDGKNGWVLFPLGNKGLNPNEITIAEILKKRGYATACVGKWHLGDQREYLPTRQGFDQYFGIPYSNDMGGRRPEDPRPPLPLLRNETVIEAPVDQTTITKRYTEEALEFITAHKDESFFLYFPHTMPHNPVAASPAFAGKSANKGYGDSVEEIDWSVGEILATLKRLGIDDKTLVLFTSDNGAASNWGGRNLPLSGFKGSTMEGGMRVPGVLRWPGQVPAGTECNVMSGTIDVLPTLAGLAGAAVPRDRIIDGKDIWPLWSGAPDAESPHEVFYFYWMDQLQALRSGRWKLHLERDEHPKRVRKNKDGTTQPVKHYPARLYDVEADIAEKADLIGAHPEVVAKLMEFAERAREDLGDLGREGANQRPAAWTDSPKPLVKDAG